jgi:hypothetical protein
LFWMWQKSCWIDSMNVYPFNLGKETLKPRHRPHTHSTE